MLNNWFSGITKNNNISFFDFSFIKGNPVPEIKSGNIVFFSKSHELGKIVRNALDKLINNFNIDVIDLGENSISNISSVFQIISDFNQGDIFPIFLGVSNEDFIELSKAFNKQNDSPKSTFVSNQSSPSIPDLNIQNLGFQRHLLTKHVLQEINENKFLGLSLGGLRSNQDLVEPVLRDVNYLHFDIAAIRRSEVPLVDQALPTGLYTEEACQLMRYLGEGNNTNLVSFASSESTNFSEIEGMVIAQLIWYLVEGKNLQTNEHPSTSVSFKKYIVELNEIEHSIEFHQSETSGKWWLKSNDTFIPCAYKEYQETLKNGLPERLLRLI